MSAPIIMTALCPGGSVQLQRLPRLIQTDRVHSTPGRSDTVALTDLDQAFEVLKTKDDETIKPLIEF